MTKTPDADDSRSRRFKIGYVASHAYRLTFEINEIIELLRRYPDARIYSFYRPREAGIQTERVREVPGEIVTWSFGAILAALVYFLLRSPLRLGRAAAALAWASKSNPVYWVKNGVVFAIALPILADARRHRVTHLHADFGSSPATIAWLGRHLLGTGFSVRYHSFDIHLDTLGWRDPLRRRKLRDADLVVAVHHDGVRHLRNKVPGLAGDKFKMIRISVAFHPLPKPERLPEPPLVLAAGNLVPAKGFDVLVRAAGVLKERNVPIRLRILGEGTEREHLTRLVRENGIEDRVEMPGYFQHIEFARHLADAMVLVCPARVTHRGVREGLPTVIPEAWLSRTPVIAAPIGGIPEVVEDGKTGLLFPAENATALAECIARLIASSDLRRSLAENGHDRAVEEFSPEKNVRELLGEIEAHSHPARGCDRGRG
jgi:glycosyltransferase involved in cell wall biosynthesis